MFQTGCLLVEPFESFGDSQWAALSGSAAREFVLPRDAGQARARVRQEVPDVPGVYGMVDASGELVYVGKSKKLRSRLVSYFSKRASREKADRIVERAARIAWEPTPDEFAALLRELELIRRWRPRLNVQGQPGRFRRVFVCVGRPPAAHVYLSASPGGNELAAFGPVSGVRLMRRAVRRLNDLLGLRDCPMSTPIYFTEQKELFSRGDGPRCLRHALGNCLAPCAALCDEDSYSERVRAARDFLGGRDHSLLRVLEDRMTEASREKQFERAAALRDLRRELEVLHDDLRRVRQVRRHYTFVYRVVGEQGGETWYLLRQGQVAAALAAPGDGGGAAVCREAIERTYSHRQLGPEDLDVTLLVASWFRRHPEQLRETLAPQQATAACVRTR